MADSTARPSRPEAAAGLRMTPIARLLGGAQSSSLAGSRSFGGWPKDFDAIDDVRVGVEDPVQEAIRDPPLLLFSVDGHRLVAEPGDAAASLSVIATEAPIASGPGCRVLDGAHLSGVRHSPRPPCGGCRGKTPGRLPQSASLMREGVPWKSSCPNRWTS